MQWTEALDAIAAILEPDATYSGADIVLHFKSHTEAIAALRKAREALKSLQFM